MFIFKNSVCLLTLTHFNTVHLKIQVSVCLLGFPRQEGGGCNLQSVLKAQYTIFQPMHIRKLMASMQFKENPVFIRL